jgi:hypothetical protein
MCPECAPAGLRGGRDSHCDLRTAGPATGCRVCVTFVTIGELSRWAAKRRWGTRARTGPSVRRLVPSRGYPRLRTSQTVITAKAVASAASAAPVIAWKYQKRSADW